MKKLLNIFKPKNTITNTSTKRTVTAAPSHNLLNSIMNELPVHQTWLDAQEIARIKRDATVISAFGSRKAATLKKELIIESSDKKLKEALETTFNYKMLRKILDTPIQGCSVFEINWVDNLGILRPDLIERDYRQFLIIQNELKYAPHGVAQDIPPYKALYSTYEDKHNRPMGTPLADALFWPVKFKNASLGFWVKFLEKYGSPWAIGKTEGDKDQMADELYAMLGGDSAVIDIEDEITVHQIQRSGDFDKLTEYCDNQIRQIILGGNLTSEVKGGSFAAANVHNDIREDIAMTDENLTLELIKEAVRFTKEINHLSSEVTVTLKDKDDPNIQLSERDKRISEMGWTPTKEYIESTYNIKVNAASKAPVANALKTSKKLFVFGAQKPADTLEGAIDSINLKKIELTFQKQIIDILDRANTFEEAIEALQEAYPKTELQELQELMESAMINAEILARVEVEDESEEE